MIKNKNILLQEEEFIKLNEKIDLTTRDLLNQVDQIKELQLNNDNYTESITKINAAGHDTGRQKQSPSNASLKSSECDFALKEYFSARKDDASDLENGLDLPTLIERDKPKDSRPFNSAKITPAVVSSHEEDTLSLGIVRHKSDLKIKERKLESDVIPKSLKGVGQDGITRFLSAKVKLLTQQIEVIQRDEKKHLEKIKELQAYKEKSTEEREKLIQQINTSRSALVKYEHHANSVTAQLQTTHTENSHLKKELETLKKEIRQNNKNHSASEIKLNRALEETEKLKVALQQLKQEEKERREIQRKKIENLTGVIKKLDRQRTELLNGFKKQLLVIDNLRKQKDLTEAWKLLKFSEDDFINFLDSNPTNTVRTSDTLKSAKS